MKWHVSSMPLQTDVQYTQNVKTQPIMVTMNRLRRVQSISEASGAERDFFRTKLKTADEASELYILFIINVIK